MNEKIKTHNNQHAVVIGASMAGLMAARVLSDYFKHVTVIERDRLPEGAETRKGVAQGQHLHALLAKGADVLAELFPGLLEALTQNGAVLFTSVDMKLYRLGAWVARYPGSIHMYSQGRPFLEQYVRSFLTACANVRFLDVCEVTRLLATEDSRRVTGVSLHYRSGERREEELAADLVVDASGRGSRAPRWLMSLGHVQVEETSVKVDVGYATRIYRRPSHLPIDWKILGITPMPPNERRGGGICLIEGDRWIASLSSSGQDYLPDDESFLDYARSLSQPDFYEAIKEAEPLTPVFTYKYPANRWRHYERMSRFPDGFIILGDAVCSFNPIYGQGMTVAALEAKTLDACLRRHARSTSKQESGFAHRFQKAIAKVVEWPWQLATSEDLRNSGMGGKQPRSIRLLNWYIQRVLQLTASDPLVLDQFNQVTHMLKPPIVLFDPRIVRTVLRQELASRRSLSAPLFPSDESSPTGESAPISNRIE